ncbi:MAG: TIM-barrel domain-containing protein [Vicinamibacteria bacterium]
MNRGRVAFQGALLALALTTPAAAGWQSLERLPPPRPIPGGLLFADGRASVSVQALAGGVVRVRFSPGPSRGRDHSYALAARPAPDRHARIEIGAGASRIETAELRVGVRHAPFGLRIEAADGTLLDEDDAERGTAWAGAASRVWKRLRDDDHVYGFGEKAGRLDKRGVGLGGSALAMWNTDAYAYDASTDPLYASVPFFMVLRAGRAHGFFLDNTQRSFFDVGREAQELLSFGTRAGELDYYFLDGPTPKQVLERYAALTGRAPLPPLWSLGYHQSRYSYYPEARVREIARGFRERSIPADTLWLDIHYLDGFAPFTWDRERFPDPRGMIADLRRAGFRLVTIVDPHPKRQPGSAVYDSGLAGGHFVTRPDGSIYEDAVWPSAAEKDPGPSVFPDFSRPAARAWWGSLHRELVEQGVAGIWNDMNEPAVFRPPTGTMPLELRHDNEGEPTDHAEIHNVYGMLMTRATHEGLLALRPDVRPFVLTRASFAGGQRYAALWPGDNTSDWHHLRQSVPILLGLGLSGFPFVGSDIGGFIGSPSAELFTRWLQAGVFSTFMRTHTAFGTADQEPWSYGPRHEAINRRAIELRYELLPQLYDLMQRASETGLPPLRPLFLEFPEDPKTWALDDQFLWGDSLLVAPVLGEGASERSVYLPAGDWYDFGTGARRAGGGSCVVPVSLESIPIFARAGAFVFRQPAVPHTGAMAGNPLQLDAYPAARSAGRLYEDAGDGFAYRAGAFLLRRFEQARDAGGVELRVAAPEGSWRPAPRDLVVRLLWDGRDAPRRARAAEAPLAREASAARPGSWSYDGTWVTLRLRDRFDAFVLRVE